MESLHDDGDLVHDADESSDAFGFVAGYAQIGVRLHARVDVDVDVDVHVHDGVGSHPMLKRHSRYYHHYEAHLVTREARSSAMTHADRDMYRF